MIDYDRLNRERAAFEDYQVRERALMLAQNDCHKGIITIDQVIGKARDYEAFLMTQPASTDSAPAVAATP
jgi:hypothetical protein